LQVCSTSATERLKASIESHSDCINTTVGGLLYVQCWVQHEIEITAQAAQAEKCLQEV